MAKFETGEEVIIKSIIGNPDANGELIKYIGRTFSSDYYLMENGWEVLNLDDGRKYVVDQENIRKKHPPEYEASSWDDQVFQELGWNPSKLGVE